tara:strand:- start:18 stop:587 length:570 start_codon:yes stop_codon:yes gene_type:complete
MKILMINNKDSFVYNLVDYILRLQSTNVVVVDNLITDNDIDEIQPDKIIISPGPGKPKKSGRIIDVIKQYYKEIPILGVCLGHQAIYESFGGRIDKIESGPVHGKTSKIIHDKKTIYVNIPNPFQATRYHSLEAKIDTLPRDLEVTSWTQEGTIMGIRHSSYEVEGVQFHPESIITNHGIELLNNFLKR